MVNKFGCQNWKDFIPQPIFDDKPEYFALYEKAWELAYDHIKYVDGMPQTPYMDEAFCDTQVWIWDSCFMALFCKYARDVFPGVETLRNFYEVLYGGKRLATVIPGEEEPAWVNPVPGEPYEIQIHIADNPPLFAWAEYENLLISGDVDYIKKLLYEEGFLQKHYDWLEGLREKIKPDGVMNNTCLISEKEGYRWEGGRSGMDNTPRGRKGERALKERPNNPDMLWVDALCQQALSAKLISKMFEIVDDKEKTEKWHNRFLDKKEIINRLYWDSDDEFYYDIDINTHDFMKVMSIASYWTMTSETTTKERADKLVKHLFNAKLFGGIVPFVSLSRSDSDFNPRGGYWRGSVWLPTAYATLKGLANYGYFKEAYELALKLLEHMIRTYEEYEPHTIWECYSPEEFKPASRVCGENQCVRPDFCGWSALGPISIYIEFVLGFYEVDAIKRVVRWAKQNCIHGNIGIKNLRFGDIVTSICAFGEKCIVESNETYNLDINGRIYLVKKGVNEFALA